MLLRLAEAAPGDERDRDYHGDVLACVCFEPSEKFGDHCADLLTFVCHRATPSCRIVRIQFGRLSACAASWALCSGVGMVVMRTRPFKPQTYESVDGVSVDVDPLGAFGPSSPDALLTISACGDVSFFINLIWCCVRALVWP
jgi:hypothetical protein